ncbi:hypothetical protein HOU02_gp199 [Caulobacter phage CcrBL9]|uniref:Uncharacterized protein n=2 Tax=Bertelyvirus TaxID=2733152 RepID=A0A385EGX4_9CAUD|nr:hypothetical protein HOU02_gp199 [Caulobacter phage CcrBL9]YP_009810699.1 hypothetical protein HOU03_gp199 [Caulobacter phage CcrSC]AXQ69526.1 hypothetical protein CcrBL9_gp502 [Caulobacter phage CcrBL9]AXQ70069.1 hypothetical protein CcrSC_gp487 [Caulobacter phage CcrSC]
MINALLILAILCLGPFALLAAILLFSALFSWAAFRHADVQKTLTVKVGP